MAENAGSHYGSLGTFGGDNELGWAIRIPKQSSPLTGWSYLVTPDELCFGGSLDPLAAHEENSKLDGRRRTGADQ